MADSVGVLKCGRASGSFPEAVLICYHRGDKECVCFVWLRCDNPQEEATAVIHSNHNSDFVSDRYAACFGPIHWSYL